MPDTAKPRLAFYWCAACGGCEETVLDLDEALLPLLDRVEIAFWPVALDFKKRDLEAMPDGSITAALVNGAVRTTEQAEMARLLRRKSRLLVAFGACAQLGGIPGLANQFDAEQLLAYVYGDAPTVAGKESRPRPVFGTNGAAVTLPALHDRVRALDQVVDVDYYVPGCPPTPKLLAAAVETLLSDHLPPKGSVLAPDLALCSQCPRRDTKPADLRFTELKRPHLTPIDPGVCFLAQGIVCLGPATRAGCEALCMSGNMPCSGCFGPISRVRDQGAKMLSALASGVDAEQEREIDTILAGIPDPVGTFYRYGLARSLLRGALPRRQQPAERQVEVRTP